MSEDKMEKLNKKQALETALYMLTMDVQDYLINQYGTMTVRPDRAL